MASWNSLSFKFDPFEPLKPPLQSALAAIQVVAAVLEAILDILKSFLLDFLNPLLALIRAILAAIRAIINQIKSTGFAVLVVHPDFSQPDAAGIINSVSGAYPGFESKVVSKFFDSSDIFRPQYPGGSAVAMLVFYLGADSPGDLLGLLAQLLRFLNTPVDMTFPAPVSLRVLPAIKSGSPVANFRALFTDDLDKSLVVEWRMPGAPSGSGIPGLVGQVTALYNSYRFPGFIVERTGPFPARDGAKQLSPNGELVQIPIQSTTLGKGVQSLVERYGFPAPSTKVVLREENDAVYRFFPDKLRVDGAALAEGALTGSYQYIDDDPALVEGSTYYYRVRAFFGEPTGYLNAKTVDDAKKLAKRVGNRYVLRTENGVSLGKPSQVVKGVVPRPRPGDSAFDAYKDLYDAVLVGILLNFDMPAATALDNQTRTEQKTGWGTLSVIGGKTGAMKAFLKTSDKFIEGPGSLLVGPVIRRLINPVLERLYESPDLFDIVATKWLEGAKATVEHVLGTGDPRQNGIPVPWGFVSVVGGVTASTGQRLDAYLALSDAPGYGEPAMAGPLPVSGTSPYVVGVQERQDLADFIRTAIGFYGASSSYLAWYSLTVGDLFPAFIPFLYDFEQFILALLNALKNALQEIIDIVETLLQKVRAIEQILQTILDILDILEIRVVAAVMGTVSTNGSAASLAGELMASQNKPGDSPFGLHSGVVLTFGGPGEGFIAAFRAIGFLLGL
jgi:hypothetical protein